MNAGASTNSTHVQLYARCVAYASRVGPIEFLHPRSVMGRVFAHDALKMAPILSILVWDNTGVGRARDARTYRESWQMYSNISPPSIHFDGVASVIVHLAVHGPV